MENSIRKLKIYRTYYHRDFYCIAGFSPPHLPPVPLIRLQGRWLERVGFVEGANIIIHVNQNRLIIEVDKEKQ